MSTLVGMCAWLFATWQGAANDKVLDVLVAAQETNLASYESGRMHVRLTIDRQGSHEKESVDGVFSWNGEFIHARYHRQVFANGKLAEHEDDARLIETPATRLWHEPRINLATRNRPQARKYARDSLRVLPSERWFSFISNPGGRKYRDFLDPRFVQDQTRSFEVRQKTPSEVTVTRTYLDGSSLVLDFNLAQGGNMTSYNLTRGLPLQAPESLHERGEYSWTGGPEGFVLSHAHGVLIDPSTGNTVIDELLEVLDFDRSPSLPSDLFTIAGLELAPGTEIEDRTTSAKRRTVYGRPGPPILEAELSRLAERLRDKGFSARSRRP